MLPAKIKELIASLKNRTEAGELQWNYDDNDAEIRLEQDRSVIKIKYDFNTMEEVGQFRISYLEKSTNKQYYFSTTEEYRDYELVRQLYDSAQASDLDLDL